MMRKIWCVAAALLLVLLAGCSKKEAVDMPYEIIEENGSYYIILDEELLELAELIREYEGFYSGLKPTPKIQFESVSEMKHKIETADLTESELLQLVQFPADDTGRIPIMDLESLYQPGYPSNFGELSVYWRGATYDFYSRASDEELCFCMYMLPSKENWEKAVDSWCGFKEMDNIEVIDLTTQSERNAEVISYQILSDQYQKAYYTIQNGDDILHVFESYDVLEDVAQLERIDLYGFTNGYYLNAEITARSSAEYFQQPSVKWLSQFEMKDYTEVPAWLLPVGLGGAVLVVGAGVFALCRKKRKSSTSFTPASDREYEG